MNPQHFLIIRFSAIGDILLTTPLLRAIKQTFPSSQVSFVTRERYRDLLENNRHIDQLFLLPEPGRINQLIGLREKIQEFNPDTIVDLHGNIRSIILKSTLPGSRYRYPKETLRRWKALWKKEAEKKQVQTVPERYFSAIRSLNILPDKEGLEFFGEETENDHEVIGQAGLSLNKPYIILAPGAGRPTKSWPPEYFASAIDILEEKHYHTALIGSLAEKKLCHQIDGMSTCSPAILSGELSLKQTGIVLRHAAGAICNDSGMMHLATAVKTPVAALFGPTTEIFGFYPYRATAKILEVDLPCRPCSRHGAYKCRKEHFRCMRDITPVMAVNALLELIK
jgi:heptosyltransferase-2